MRKKSFLCGILILTLIISGTFLSLAQDQNQTSGGKTPSASEVYLYTGSPLVPVGWASKNACLIQRTPIGRGDCNPGLEPCLRAGGGAVFGVFLELMCPLIRRRKKLSSDMTGKLTDSPSAAGNIMLMTVSEG